MNRWYILKGIKIGIFVIGGILLFGFIIMQLWNFVIPAMFGLPEIAFLQALGLLILAKLLFGFRGGSWGGHGFRARSYWRKRFEEKISKMTPEEQEKYKKHYYGRFGCYPDPDDSLKKA